MWCRSRGATEGLFLLGPRLERDWRVFSAIVLRITDIDGARLRVNAAECVDKLTTKSLISRPTDDDPQTGLALKASPWAWLFELNSSSPKQQFTRKPCKTTRTRIAPTNSRLHQVIGSGHRMVDEHRLPPQILISQIGLWCIAVRTCHCQPGVIMKVNHEAWFRSIGFSPDLELSPKGADFSQTNMVRRLLPSPAPSNLTLFLLKKNEGNGWRP